MSGALTVEKRHRVALTVWPELALLGRGYQFGHALIVECVLADEPAPVDEATRQRIKEAAAGFLQEPEKT